MEGKSIRIIHRSDEAFRSFGEAVNSVIPRDGYFRTEWEFMHKNGTIFPVETVVSPIKSSDGTTVCTSPALAGYGPGRR